MLYVAMTRGRDTNTAYLYERPAEHEYRTAEPKGIHVTRRDRAHHASRLARMIIANNGEPVTAHDVAAQTPSAVLPERIARLIDLRAAMVSRRRTAHQAWHAEQRTFTEGVDQIRERGLGRDRDLGYGMDM